MHLRKSPLGQRWKIDRVGHEFAGLRPIARARIWPGFGCKRLEVWLRVLEGGGRAKAKENVCKDLGK